MKKRFLLTLTMLLTGIVGILADGVYFTYDPGKYEQQTHVFAAFADNNGTRLNDNTYTYYLGAFIGGECRYEAVQQVGPSDDCFFDLMVGGNTSEVGQRITFRVYKVLDDPTGAPSVGTEYWLDESQYFTFNADDRTTDVSNPKLLTFMPVPSVMIDPEIKVYKGQTIDLTTHIYKESYETLPVITWDGSEQGGEYYTLEGHMLTAVNKTVEPMGVPLIVRWGNEEMRVNIIIEVMATSVAWQEQYRNGITVPVGDEDVIGEVLASGYTLTPADASTTFTWTSSNTEVVDFVGTRGIWMPLSTGTATLTGTADDDSGLTLSLVVTVIQPVNAIRLAQTEIYVELGSDITDRLNALVDIYPNNATNKNFTWRIDEGNTSVTWNNGRFIASAITQPGDINTLTVTAQDGYGASAQLTVNVVGAMPKTLTVRQETLFLTFDPTNPGKDCTAEVMGNLVLTPEGLALADYFPRFVSSNEEVIAMEYSPVGTDVAFKIMSAGESDITVTITFEDQTEMSPAGGPTMRDLSVTFKVNVRDGLGGFSFEPVQMTKEETYTLTLTPQPVGSEYDATKISISVLPSSRISFPDGWVFVETTPVEGSNGLSYTLDAKSVGQGEIRVSYDGDEMGRGSISVNQKLHLADGWQWIALYEGSMSEDDVNAAIGDKLSDLRSQDAYIINDSKLGYFGSLTTIDQLQTYKLRLTDVGNDGLTVVPQGDGYMQKAQLTPGIQLELRKGWNWIGNPYQYYQTLGTVLAGNSFTNGDWIKGKTTSATFNGTEWTGQLRYLTPGEGVLIYVQNAGTITLQPEFKLTQQETAPLGARAAVTPVASPWTFNHSQFENNMAMVARVSNVGAPSRVTVWAFVGNECRGQGEAIGDLQFITVHGVAGERVTFKLYDELTGLFHDVYGSRTLTEISGSFNNPVLLFAGQATTISDSQLAGSNTQQVFDLQGRQVGNPQFPTLNSQLKKGIYIQNGRKVVK